MPTEKRERERERERERGTQQADRKIERQQSYISNPKPNSCLLKCTRLLEYTLTAVRLRPVKNTHVDQNCYPLKHCR